MEIEVPMTKRGYIVTSMKIFILAYKHGNADIRAKYGIDKEQSEWYYIPVIPKKYIST